MCSRFRRLLSPSWQNIIAGQIIYGWYAAQLTYHDPSRRKIHKLNDEIATLVVRPGMAPDRGTI
ncbi:MAG: hypothetical protein R3D26_07850 [Cyanobacteriota/Melainabacteria group bacterium]